MGMRLLARIEDPSVRRYAVETLVGAHASQDAQGAWRSAQSFRREEYGPGLLADTLTRWAFTSPNAAMRELLALPPDLRDATIVAIGGTTLLRRLGPARAEEALDVLESESARRRLADGFARYYADTNPDEEKAEFFRHIATPPPR